MRLLALLFLLMTGAATQAQEPRVTLELSESETLVGQPLELVVNVLVPTWMPKPPVYPTFEVPSLMVRLPEKSTVSISQRVDGATWAGVRRTYRLYPLVPGTFEIPPQAFTITYADPDTRDPVVQDIPSPAVSFASTIPAAARTLDPLIVARAFTLEQTIEGENTLAPGDAVVRTVRATIDGTTVVMIPTLVSASDTPGLRSYPAEPTITEAEDGRNLSGTREEKVTYLAQSSGTATLPQIRFDWYNIDTGEIETVSVPEFSVTVEGIAEPAEDGITREQLIRVAIGLAVLALVVLLVRRFKPQIDAWITALRDRWHTSERYARSQVQHAIKAGDLTRTYSTLEVWVARTTLTEAELQPLATALAEVGKATHGTGTGAAALKRAWQEVSAAFRAARRENTRLRKSAHVNRLPPLNPF